MSNSILINSNTEQSKYATKLLERSVYATKLLEQSKYAILTREQKTRKQAIRNWKRAQRELVEYCIFADICKHVYNKEKKERELTSSLRPTERTTLRNEAISRRKQKKPLSKESQLIDIEMQSTRDNLKYSLRDILKEHDIQDSYNYKNELLAESVVDYLYK